MNKIRAAIVEDELPAARLLESMVLELRPQWDVVVLPGSIEEAAAWLAVNSHPDIMFLDIQLADGISFHLIEQAHPQSMIVFTTAYDEYAVRAFTVNSVDYLLKPVRKERLAEAIRKFERYSAAGCIAGLGSIFDAGEFLNALSSGASRQYRTRFLVASGSRFSTLQVADIAYFRSEDKITYAVTRQGRSHIVDMTLSKLEEQLDPKIFFRVNRQFILSAASVCNIEPYFGGKWSVRVTPPCDRMIQVSREKIAALKMWLDF